MRDREREGEREDEKKREREREREGGRAPRPDLARERISESVSPKSAETIFSDSRDDPGRGEKVCHCPSVHPVPDHSGVYLTAVT